MGSDFANAYDANFVGFAQRNQDRQDSLYAQQLAYQSLMNQTLTTTNMPVSNGQWSLGSTLRYSDLLQSYGDFNRYAEPNRDASEAAKTKHALKVLDQIKAAAKPFKAKELDKGVSEEAARYRRLGLTSIAEVIESKAMKAWKELEISLAGYKRINREELEKFKQDLYNSGDMRSKRTLQETPLDRYMGQNLAEGDMVADAQLAVPPADVLEKLEVAQKSKLFDAFSVLHIKYVPDPILCGRIAESQDLYFIAEWGDDVKLTDIVK